jgi:hypothetical protein
MRYRGETGFKVKESPSCLTIIPPVDHNKVEQTGKTFKKTVQRFKATAPLDNGGTSLTCDCDKCDSTTHGRG